MACHETSRGMPWHAIGFVSYDLVFVRTRVLGSARGGAQAGSKIFKPIHVAIPPYLQTVEDRTDNKECSRGARLRQSRGGGGGGGGDGRGRGCGRGGGDGDGDSGDGGSAERQPEDGGEYDGEDGKTPTTETGLFGEDSGVVASNDGVFNPLSHCCPRSPRRRTPSRLHSPRTTPSSPGTTAATTALDNRGQRTLLSEGGRHQDKDDQEMRNFYDACEAAVRSRKLREAYSAGSGPRYGSNDERAARSRGQSIGNRRASASNKARAMLPF